MGLLVVRPGVMTTVQDLGRVGYRRFGVPVGGAFDLGSFALANALLGNPPDAAALEFTLVGGAYKAETDLAIALAGAPLAATVEPESGPPRPWSIPQTGTLRQGETLVLGGTPTGARAYLAVRGGWQTPLILASRSTEAPLQPRGLPPPPPGTTTTRRPAPDLVAAFSPPLDPAPPIRWIPGPDLPTTPLTGPYRVLDQSSRMGLRPAGPPILVPTDPNRPSSPVAPGAIQVAGDQPILLGVAGGTIGGYPHVAHVITADLDRLAQLRPGSVVTFEPIPLATARHLDQIRRQTQAQWQARLALWAQT